MHYFCLQYKYLSCLPIHIFTPPLFSSQVKKQLAALSPFQDKDLTQKTRTRILLLFHENRNHRVNKYTWESGYLIIHSNDQPRNQQYSKVWDWNMSSKNFDKLRRTKGVRSVRPALRLFFPPPLLFLLLLFECFFFKSWIIVWLSDRISLLVSRGHALFTEAYRNRSLYLTLFFTTVDSWYRFFIGSETPL